jgi:hypothetical protein
MFVVDSKKWHPELAIGQERLLIELWIESAGSDTSRLYLSPICSVLDRLLFQFIRNPTLSLANLHEINAHNFDLWKKRLRDEKSPVPLVEILEMPQPGLTM